MRLIRNFLLAALLTTPLVAMLHTAGASAETHFFRISDGAYCGANDDNPGMFVVKWVPKCPSGLS